MNFQHYPVLLSETLQAFEYLTETQNATFVDCTLGLAGHSLALIEQAKNSGTKIKVIGIDKDKKALEIASGNIRQAGAVKHFKLIHDDFHNFIKVLENLGIKKVDGILLDLGVSSMQLDDKFRGFSFSDPDMPLDMRMDQSQMLDASYIINHYSQSELGKVLQRGEEKHWRKVAANICQARKSKPIETAGDLINILAKSLPAKYGKTHFATDTFRALRLEVNDELEPLVRSMDDMVSSLAPGGRLAIITFHSLEDRIVKNEFKRLANPCTCPPQLPRCVCGLTPSIKIITTKPIIASDSEIKLNPRARSAKLRIVEKLSKPSQISPTD